MYHNFFIHSSVFFFSFIFISWRLITSQHCSGFCHTLTWISHGVTCIPHPDPPSHLPLHLIVDRHLGCIHVLALVNGVAMHVGVHVSFSILVSSKETRLTFYWDKLLFFCDSAFNTHLEWNIFGEIRIILYRCIRSLRRPLIRNIMTKIKKQTWKKQKSLRRIED